MSAAENVDSARFEKFQVIVRILEARNLVGLDIDPCVDVTIGDQKKVTKTKKSTNAAVFEEDFLFDFSLPAAVFQQQIITIEAISDSRLFRRSTSIGVFKIDIATVKQQPESCFLHKWALLLDSEDPLSGPKGYVKCDLIVCVPGVVPKTAPDSGKGEDEDIEGNLLVPEDFSNTIERHPARYFVTIYEARDLPPMNTGVMASMKKAFVGDAPKELVDPFVQVSFAGKTGKTSVKKNCANPKWNEEIIFTEMFPSLVKIIRVHVKDDNQSVIATTFLDFTTIADNSMNGFLPTFGPAWLNLYGNHRINTDSSPLNYGLGEGLAYRGRLKLSLSVQILDQPPKKGMHKVEVKSIHQNQTNVEMAPLERFMLFCTIFEANMIDKMLAGKSAKFEINFANVDSAEEMSGRSREDSSRKNVKQEFVVTESQTQSKNGIIKTPSVQMLSNDKFFCSLPNNPKKPCMHTFVNDSDYRKRLFMINRLNNILHDLKSSIKQVKLYLAKNYDSSFVKTFFVDCVERILESFSFVINTLEGEYISTEIATFLDFEKQRQRKREINSLVTTFSELKKKLLEKGMTADLVHRAENCLPKIQLLTIEPQDSMPDVFLWLICDRKKVAYKRFKPENILFSMDDAENGKYCAKIQSIFLKSGVVKENEEPAVCAHVSVYFWLGTVNEKTKCTSGLPPCYRTYGSDLIDDFVIPNAVEYTEANEFELRCHLFQGRSLIGSDESGLSDPFIRVSFQGQCRQSQIIEQTLCPLWDETLVISNITIYGSGTHLEKQPPNVILQVYDYDKLGENEFLGQTEVPCVVKLASEPYRKPKFPPSLLCCSLMKNKLDAGEILAACELIQVGDNVKPYPELHEEETKQTNVKIVRIPQEIKPILSDYKLEVLFWGLRDLKTSSVLPVDQPKIQVDWGNGILESEAIVSYKKNPNFTTLRIPDDADYQPPITIRCVDSRAFGRNVLIGTCTVTNVRQYILPSFDAEDEYDGDSTLSSTMFSLMKSTKDQIMSLKTSQKLAASLPNLSKVPVEEKEKRAAAPSDSSESLSFDKQSLGTLTASYSKCEALDHVGTEVVPKSKTNSDAAVSHSPSTVSGTTTSSSQRPFDKSHLDWWSKYYASVEALEAVQKMHQSEVCNAGDATYFFFIGQERKKKEAAPKLYQKSKVPPNRRVKEFGKKLFSSKSELIPPSTDVEHRKEDAETKSKKLAIATFQIYDKELENVKEFHGFNDCFESFNLYRGKKLSNELDDSARVVGQFKGRMCLRKIIKPSSQSPLLPRALNNEPLKIIVRIYIIKAINLRPCDPTGKADPYLNIILGKTKVCDKANKIVCQLNPLFGRFFEIEAKFPEETELLIQIFDWDRLSSDDLMGETKIDLEQRYYSKHRATSGLAVTYENDGYNVWRDSMKPTQLLTKFCKLYGLSGPTYTKTTVTVDDRVFTFSKPPSDQMSLSDNENLALACLHQFHELPKVGYKLVPEHVETRTLYLPEKPGMEQDGSAVPPPVVITPRKPKSYELRVIVWDTKEVILDDYNALTGTSSVDQYIKSFIISPDVDGQHTDVHYRSLNGDGNFNWRFVYKFDYFDAEEKIVYRTKQSLFSLVENEEKIPAKLNMQVWDADVISADDFLGTLTFTLTKIPRGAKNAKGCSLNTLKPKKGNKKNAYLNIFEVKRTRGWYPFVRQENNSTAEIAGKVDLELQLMSAEEAEKKPAGHGRDAPDPMPEPQ